MRENSGKKPEGTTEINSALDPEGAGRAKYSGALENKQERVTTQQEESPTTVAGTRRGVWLIK